MPRVYDKVIRFYDSWFSDLCDPDKGFTAEEFKCVILAICEAQRALDCAPLDLLPPSIKRGLQMATLKEQVWRLIEKTAAQKERGRRGGEATAAAVERARQAEQMKAADAHRALSVPREAIPALREAGLLDDNLRYIAGKEEVTRTFIINWKKQHAANC